MFWISEPRIQRRCQSLISRLASEFTEPDALTRWREDFTEQAGVTAPSDLEALADALSSVLFTAAVPGFLNAVLIDEILVLLTRSFESSGDDRKAAIVAKHTAIKGILALFIADLLHSSNSESIDAARQIDPDPTAHEREAQLASTNAANAVLQYVTRLSYGDAREGLRRRDSVELVQQLVETAGESEKFNPFLGAALCHWVNERLSAPGVQIDDDRASSLAVIELKCLESIIRFEGRADLQWLEFMATADLAFRTVYSYRDFERARGLAGHAVQLGSALWERTTRDAKKAELVERIAPLCRLLSDGDVVATWLERGRKPRQRQAAAFEQSGNFPEAAHVYSQLAFQSFVAAEFSQATRLYLLSSYYFDKAHYFLRRGHADNADASADNYRIFEARGFSAASSARGASDAASAADQFADAAQHLARASRMAWRAGPEILFASHMFYDSAAHFCLAMSKVYRAAFASSAEAHFALCQQSAQALGKCFPMFYNVFKGYAAVLELAVSPGAHAPEQIRRALVSAFYPEPEALIKTATLIQSAIAEGDPRPLTLQLAQRMLFIDPRG